MDAREAPGPRGQFLLGSLLKVKNDPLRFFLEVQRTYGDVAQVRLGPFRLYLVCSAEGIRRVLVDNARNYEKSRSYDGLRLVLGRGLLTSEGDLWMRQRRLAQPAFHRDRLAGFVSLMAGAARRMIERWQALPDGHRLDVHAEMMRVTLQVVALALFGTDVDEAAAAVSRALAVVVKFADEYGIAPVRLPLWVPTRANRSFRQALRILDEVVSGIIRRRHQDQRDAPDLLQMLMDARDEETGLGMDPAQLKDEVMTLLLAGHETTANNLTWTFLLLSRHPSIGRSLHEEAESALGDRDPTVEDLPRLRLASMVIQESLRLFPPVWSFERQAKEDDVLDGYRVPKNAIVAISPWVLHRHTSCWQNPEGFDPDRFRPEAAASRSRFAYLPFSTGPRQCIGGGFALMEAQIILAMVTRRFRLDAAAGHAIEMEPIITLRPRGGMPMTIHRAS